MTNKERLMAALFANPAREHVNIKFFVLGGFDLSRDRLCGEAADMLEQMDASEGDTEFAESFQQREASDFAAHPLALKKEKSNEQGHPWAGCWQRPAHSRP